MGFETLKMKALLGDPLATCDLAIKAANERRFHEAGILYLLSAEQGSVEALWNIGLIFAEGLDEFQQKIELGRGLIFAAAKAGHPSAIKYCLDVLSSKPSAIAQFTPELEKRFREIYSGSETVPFQENIILGEELKNAIILEKKNVLKSFK